MIFTAICFYGYKYCSIIGSGMRSKIDCRGILVLLGFSGKSGDYAGAFSFSIFLQLEGGRIAIIEFYL